MGARDTLLLDLGYQPLLIICWRRALCLHFGGKVEVVSSHESWVRTPSAAYQIPAVIRLLHRVRSRPWHVRFSRENVYLRDHHQCQYCGKRCNRRELTLDHVLPRSCGGKTTWKNVVTACARCNHKKGRHTPAQAGMELLNDPVRPRWLAPRGISMGEQKLPAVWRDWLAF